MNHSDLPEERRFRAQVLTVGVRTRYLQKIREQEGLNDDQSNDDIVEMAVLQFLHHVRSGGDDLSDFEKWKITTSPNAAHERVKVELSAQMSEWMHETCLLYKLSHARVIKFALYERAFPQVSGPGRM